MALINCKECGAQISTSASKCPKCGKKLKHTGLIILIMILAVFIGIGAGIIHQEIKNPGTIITNTQDQKQKVTLEKFNQIQTGMTYDEVVSIIGEEGTLSTESSYGNANMKIYYWYSEDGITNATISFMNGKVEAKSQIGLK